jgi:ribonuclease R
MQNINIDNNIDQIANGQLIINEFGNGFVNVKNNNNNNDNNNHMQNKTIYIKKQDLNRAFNNELVDVSYHQENGQYYGKIINYSLIDRTFIGFVCHFYKDQIYIYVPELKKSNMIIIKTKIKLVKGDWVTVKVVFDEDSKLYGQFINKIEDDIDVLIEQKYQLDSIEIEKEDNVMVLNQEANNNHIDQTELDTFTIDPITTQDCDDAFSIKIIDDNLIHIYVHISDVAHFINPSNKLFDTIIKRGNTYYGKNKNWPMMPREYSDNLGSILPNKKTHVVTTEFVYNRKENQIKYIGWYYSDIISKNKYHYELVDEIMESESNDIDNPFNIIYNASLLLSKEINDFDINSATKSHSLVSYWMIKTNQIMCLEVQKLNKHLYRYNAKPDDKKFDLLNNYLKYIGYNEHLEDLEYRKNIVNISRNTNDGTLKYILKSLLLKAFYSDDETENIHYGLGISNYTHWTSPIRRASDLLNHCLLKGYDIDIGSYLDYINEAEAKQTNIETFILEYNNYNKIKIGDIYDGVIISLFASGISVLITELDNKFTIHISKLSNERLIFNQDEKKLENSNTTYKLFDKIKVKVEKVDFDNLELNVIKN